MQEDNWILPEPPPAQPTPAPVPYGSPFPDNDPAQLPAAQPVTGHNQPGRTRRSPWLIGGLAVVAAMVLLTGAIFGLRAVRAANIGTFGAAATTTTTPQPGKGWGHGGPGGPEFHGGRVVTVSSVSGSTITGKDARGQAVTIKTDATTKVTRANATIKVSDLKDGDDIAVRGTKNSDGSITATEIAVVPAHVAGQVTKVGTTSFTVQDRAGTSHVVNVSATTTYHLGMQQTGSLNDIKVGRAVAATGTKNSDGSLTATDVAVQTPKTAGQITEISGNMVTVKDFRGTSTTVNVTNATTYTDASTKSTIALKDLKVGDTILADGTADSTATAFTAAGIVRIPAGFGHGHSGGPWPGNGTPPAGGSTTDAPGFGPSGQFPGGE